MLRKARLSLCHPSSRNSCPGRLWSRRSARHRLTTGSGGCGSFLRTVRYDRKRSTQQARLTTTNISLCSSQQWRRPAQVLLIITGTTGVCWPFHFRVYRPAHTTPSSRATCDVVQYCVASGYGQNAFVCVCVCECTWLWIRAHTQHWAVTDGSTFSPSRQHHSVDGQWPAVFWLALVLNWSMIRKVEKVMKMDKMSNWKGLLNWIVNTDIL